MRCFTGPQSECEWLQERQLPGGRVGYSVDLIQGEMDDYSCPVSAGDLGCRSYVATIKSRSCHAATWSGPEAAKQLQACREGAILIGEDGVF